jgi:hypothetical protein
MERALVGFSSREVAQPLRSVIEVGLQRAFVGVMPAFIPEPAALGTKVVSVFASNTAVGLPTHLATIVLLDPMTGELLSIMDGRFITEARTAAVSAVSVRHPRIGTPRGWRSSDQSCRRESTSTPSRWCETCTRFACGAGAWTIERRSRARCAHMWMRP